MAASSAGLSYQYARHLPLKPTSTEKSPYSWFRLPAPADTGEPPPGSICWGTVGEMPSPVALRSTDFNVRDSETGRKSHPVRIENPDDPAQFINVDRADEITFNRREPKPAAGANTAASDAGGIAAYDPARQKAFKPASTAPATDTKVVVEYKYGPPSGVGYGPPGGPGYGPPSGPGYGPPSG